MKKSIICTAFAALMIMAPALHAKTFSVKIANKTESIVEAVYASPTGESNWEEDLLGDKAIAVGGSYTVRFTDDRNVCKYDLRFEFRDSDYEPLEDTQDLCQLKEYEITD